MSGDDRPAQPGRRRFFASAAGAAAVTALGGTRAAIASPSSATVSGQGGTPETEPFWGRHQAGIATRQQTYAYFAAFDVTTTRREELIALLRAWTEAGARLSEGETAAVLTDDAATEPSDSGETLGLPARRLTITFGFGPGLFSKDGSDRFGLASHRPEALIDLPRFNGDQLARAGTCVFRLVQMIRKSPSTPCGNSRGWATRARRFAGRKPASCPWDGRTKRRAISWDSRTAR